MTVRIRKARPGDAASLLDLIRQHAAFEQAAAVVGDSDLTRLLASAAPPAHLLVAEDHEELTGYAALTFDYALWSAARFAHLDCLFVAEAARGGGVGRRLFEEACLLAREMGSGWIEWQTPAWNVEAIRFYERQGGTGLPKMRFSANLPA